MFSTSFTVYADEEYKENSWRYENGEPIALQDEISYARSSINAWSKQDGVIYNSLGNPIPNAISKGIDVSEWQGDIDWNKVKIRMLNLRLFVVALPEIIQNMMIRNFKEM